MRAQNNSPQIYGSAINNHQRITSHRIISGDLLFIWKRCGNWLTQNTSFIFEARVRMRMRPRARASSNSVDVKFSISINELNIQTAAVGFNTVQQLYESLLLLLLLCAKSEWTKQADRQAGWQASRNKSQRNHIQIDNNAAIQNCEQIVCYDHVIETKYIAMAATSQQPKNRRSHTFEAILQTSHLPFFVSI